MKAFLVFVLLAVLLKAQIELAPTLSPTIQLPTRTSGGPTGSSTQSTSETETAPGKSADSSTQAMSFKILAAPSLSEYQMASTVWNYLQKLGGGCCNHCNNICGFAIKRRGANFYLTNRGGWYRFESTSNPAGSRIFSLSQNEDCTWSIIDSNKRYLSVNSNYGSPWTSLIGNKVTRGVNERWYLERHSSHIHIQSASWQYYFITRTTGNIARKTLNAALNLQIEFYPCDKLAWWNY